MTEPRPPLSALLPRAVVAVIARDDQLLVIRRAAGVRAAGQHGFPGGMVECGETLEQAIVRELEEELGLEGRPLRCLWKNTTPWNVELFWWLVEINKTDEPTPNPLEVADVFWMTPRQIVNLGSLLESNRPFLHAVIEGDVRIVI